jgi:hypothetical protein
MGKCKIDKLIKKVLEQSESNDYDIACEEWDFRSVTNGDACAKCACTTPIKHNFNITNKKNQNKLILGSSCIENFNNETVKAYARTAEKKIKGTLCGCGKGKVSQNNYCRGCSKRIKGGKYTGLTMGYVYDNHTSYCTFIRDKFSYGGFLAYLIEREKNDLKIKTYSNI